MTKSIEYNKKIAERLAEIRKNKGVSQVELARELNLSQSAITSYETGLRLPNLLILTAYADYFDVSTDYILFRTEDKNWTISKKEK